MFGVQCSLVSIKTIKELFASIECHHMAETYTASQKHESSLLHTYVLNEFLTADRLYTTKYF